MLPAPESAKPWSKWHQKLHKTLIHKKNLLPDGSSLLLSISGGQDSMALLQLVLDLQRIYKWKLNIWHGDHGWHQESHAIAKNLHEWCSKNDLNFICQRTNKENVTSEKDAREWRYKNLIQQANILSTDNPSTPCTHVVTGHTGSDRAETFLMNLARGANLGGLSTLKDCRSLTGKINLVRPLLPFSRQETLSICNDLDIPFWIDPSNSDIHFTRNRIRKEIIPVLESLYAGSSIRIAKLAERLSCLNKDQKQIIQLSLQAITNSKGILREKIGNLSISAREIIFAEWLQQNKVPILSATQLEELSQKTEAKKPPGSIDLPRQWKVKWNKELIEIVPPSLEKVKRNKNIKQLQNDDV